MKTNLEKLTLIELIEEVLQDNNSKILWLNKNYRRISKKKNKVEDEYQFNYSSRQYGKVTSLHIGSSKLNINVNVQYKGEVLNTISKLKMDANISKSYCILRNGKLNIETLGMVLSKPLRLRFKKLGYILYEDIIEDERLSIINLNNLEIVNKKLIENIHIEELINKINEIEILKVKRLTLNKVIKSFLENNKIFQEEKLETLEMKYKKDFRINNNGVYYPLNNKEEFEIIQDMYVANTCEWKIQKFPKSKYEKEFIETFTSYITENKEETYTILTTLLNNIEKLQYNLEKEVNQIRIYSILENIKIFNWDDTIIKEKKSFDKDLKINMIIGDKVELSTITINDIVLRQDKYLQLIKH